MDPQAVGELLAELNAARQLGATINQLDALLAEQGHEFTYDQLVASAKASLDAPPVDPASRPLLTPDILALEAQGATFGFLDEILGAMAVPVGAPGAQGALLSGNPELLNPAARSEQVREAVRANIDELRVGHPLGALGSEMLGGFLAPGGAVARFIQRGTTAMTRAGRTIMVGTGTGALAGAGESEDLQEAPSNILGGALFGTLLSGGFAGAGQVIGAVGAPIFRGLAGNFAPNRVGRFAMAQALGEAAKKAGITGDEFREMFAELQDARPGQVVPADVVRPLQSLMLGELATADSDVAQLVSRIRQRPAGAPGRLADDLRFLADMEGLADATSKIIAAEVTGRTPQGGRAAVAFERGQEAYRTARGGVRLDAEVRTLTREAGERADEIMQAYRFGLVTEMYQDLLNTPRGTQNIGRAFSEGAEAGMSQARAETIRRVFPDDRSYRRFVQGAEVEDAFFQLKNINESGLAPEIDNQGARIMRAGRQFSVWGGRAAIFSYLAGTNRSVAKARARQLVRLLMTPGDVNAMEVQALINSTAGPTLGATLAGGGAAAAQAVQAGRSSLGDLRFPSAENVSFDQTRLRSLLDLLDPQGQILERIGGR